MTTISVVVNSRDEGGWLRETVENLRDTLPGESEVIVVDDGSQDGSAEFLRGKRNNTLAKLIRRNQAIGMTRARNLGARRSSGDVIIFCDAHMRFERDWWRPLLSALDRPKAGAAASIVGSTEQPEAEFGLGFTLPQADLSPAWVENRPASMRNPFHALFLPGCCLAMKREVFLATGGYDEGFRSRGSIDAELGIRFWLLGYQNWMVPSSRVWHYFRELAPYPVPHTDAVHNRLRTALVHFSYWRITAVMRALGVDACVGPAMLHLIDGDAGRRRRLLFSQRIHNDDWLFRKFAINW